MRPVYIVDGARTPFLKARGVPGSFSAADLASAAGAALLLRQPFAPGEIDEVILGCAAPAADEANIGRVAALRMGCGDAVPGWTVMRNCASGLQAIDSAFDRIAGGRAELVLAGGADALSRTPLLYSEAMVRWFAGWNAARGPARKLAALAGFRPAMLAPVIGLLKGLTDPIVGLSMGQTAEHLACRFDIGREQMDACALDSHRRAAAAQDAGRLAAEVVPLIDREGRIHAADDGVRRDSSIDGLARLKPFFDRPDGRITAGNSSQISDGAAWLVLASEAAIERHGLAPLARVLDIAWAGLAPEAMGLGPVHAIARLLQRHRLTLGEIDAIEINEAFAAQVLACRRASADGAYCREALALDAPLGEIDAVRLNADGGAIALGHPVGASGARLALHLAHRLRRDGGRLGVASLCIGGGQGGALLLEAA